MRPNLVNPLAPAASLWLLVGGLIWCACTGVFFWLELDAADTPPIAVNALTSLVTMYLPVLMVSVFLLGYLTRNRAPIAWREIYGVREDRAGREVVCLFVYLIVTQWLVGHFGGMGLHFPGPDTYESGPQGVADVWYWVGTNAILYIVAPSIWLARSSFTWSRLLGSLQWRRDLWIIVAYWCIDFFGPIATGANFIGLPPETYWVGIPSGILVNTLGAGLPVVVLMHVMLIPRLMILFENKLTVILLAGLFYALFSLFDPGVDYRNWELGGLSFTYIVMTQTLVGMGKATFTVVTGNPLVHFITLHVLSARIPLDTVMYGEIFKKT